MFFNVNATQKLKYSLEFALSLLGKKDTDSDGNAYVPWTICGQLTFEKEL